MSLTRPLLASLLALTLLAQQDRSDQVFRATVNVVVVPVTVTDRSGNYVSGLQPKDFVLYDNSKQQNIKVDVTFIPISLVVVVQANAASEGLLPKIAKIHSQLGPQVVGDDGEVALVAFDHRIDVLQDFTSDSGNLAKAFQKLLRAGSQTSRLNDAVRQAIRMLSMRPENHRRVILLIGETRDNGSESKARDVLIDAQVQNVLIQSVDMSHWLTLLTGRAPTPRPDPMPPAARPVPAGVPPTPEAAWQTTGGQGTSANFIPLFVEIFKQVKGIFIDNPLEVYTQYTGGREYSFKTQNGLEGAISRIGEELHNQYIVSYTPNNKVEGGFHEIKVEIVRNGRPRNDCRILNRAGYWMAAAPE